MEEIAIIMLLSAFSVTFIACDGEEQRRGTPHHEGSLPDDGRTTTGEGTRPAVDGSQATGQGPHDTLSRGDQGATSY
jgi:hypothetical protein